MLKRGSTVNAAQSLLTRLNITAAPIDVEAIATSLGAVVSYEPFTEDLSGVLIKEKSRLVIGVNSSHPKTRQRFTIAHEIGHLELQHQGEIFIDKAMKPQTTIMKRDSTSSQASDLREIEANRFAAELLMPERFVITALQRRTSKKAKIEASELIAGLAEEFQVSPQAMEYRLTNLGIFMPR